MNLTLFNSAFSKVCNEGALFTHLLITIYHILGNTTLGIYLHTCSYTIQNFNSWIKGTAHILSHIFRGCISQPFPWNTYKVADHDLKTNNRM